MRLNYRRDDMESNHMIEEREHYVKFWVLVLLFLCGLREVSVTLDLSFLTSNMKGFG